MACEETDPSCPYAPQTFVWTEEAHGLYISFLEDAFVNDLYQRLYCSVDICGYSPPSTAHTPPSAGAAECPSPAPPLTSATPQPFQPKSSAEAKGCRKRARTGCKAGAAKRKGKWLMRDVGGNNPHIFEPSNGSDKNVLSLEQPGNSSQPFGVSECVVPKGPRGGLKRSRRKGVNERFSGTEQQATDQVVPSVCQED